MLESNDDRDRQRLRCNREEGIGRTFENVHDILLHMRVYLISVVLCDAAFYLRICETKTIAHS